MQNHRKLLVWQRSHALAIEIRRATRGFPRTGYRSLNSQMIEAAESVVFTIVEGCGAASQKEFARFLDMSIKSTTELEAELELARDYGVLAHRNRQLLSDEAVALRKMLCALRSRVLGSDPTN